MALPVVETRDNKTGDTSGMEARRPRDLVDAKEIKSLSERKDSVGLLYLTIHFSLIALWAWVTWSTYGTAWFIPALLVHAFVIGFLFSPLHECAHGTAFRTRWLNESALWLVAFVYIVPPYYFRFFHLGHHRYTQIPGKDPSLVLPEPANFKQYLWYVAGLWFWWRNIRWMLKHALGRTDPISASYVPESKSSLMTSEARIMTAAYALLIAAGYVYGFLFELWICWLLPRFLGEPVQRIVRVAEHVGCAETPDLLSNTRTTLTNGLVNAIAWQMPYHAEHHLYPNVPFHALPALHRRVKDRVIVEDRGYVAGQKAIITDLLSRTGPVSAADRPGPLL